MKTVRIIEMTDDKMKYKIWHDFNKAEVTEEQLMAMESERGTGKLGSSNK